MRCATRVSIHTRQVMNMSWSVSFTATSDNGVPSLTYFDTDYGLVTLSFQYQQHFFVLKKFVIL